MTAVIVVLCPDVSIDANELMVLNLLDVALDGPGGFVAVRDGQRLTFSTPATDDRRDWRVGKLAEIMNFARLVDVWENRYRVGVIKQPANPNQGQ